MSDTRWTVTALLESSLSRDEALVAAGRAEGYPPGFGWAYGAEPDEHGGYESLDNEDFGPDVEGRADPAYG